MSRLCTGIVFRPKKGQRVSGDAYLVMHLERTYIAVLVDGLGSGEAAAKASHQAVLTTCAHVWAELPDILQQCHLALRRTRGAVMSLLKITLNPTGGGRVSYAGVGNIGFSAQAAHSFQPINANGIVGSRLPKVRVFEGIYTPGDVFALSSDGITRRFNLDQIPAAREQAPQLIAEKIDQDFSRDDDDVTVLVVASRADGPAR
ncbi:MAG: SpoIIE family protein phosphatase [Thermoflexales bacterium]|nr:SpoIIE family protein phosphatase [Thermoflexales bacterium]